MSSVLGLREFTRMRWDPRILLVDSRQASAAQAMPLDNPFFTWVRVGSRAQADHLALEISQRHLVVINEDEERALDLDEIFKSLEIQSSALEGGERGWFDALIEEQTDVHGDARVATLNRIARNQQQHLIVRDSRAIALQPSGSIAAIREVARHQGAHIEAVVDVGGDGCTAKLLANAVHAELLSDSAFEIGATPREVCGIQLRRDGPSSLEISNQTFSLSVKTVQCNHLKENVS